VATKRLPDLPVTAHVPEANRLVIAGGSDNTTVRAEGNAINASGMAVERAAEFVAATNVPKPDCLVIAGGSDDTTVRAEGNTPDRACVASQHSSVASQQSSVASQQSSRATPREQDDQNDEPEYRTDCRGPQISGATSARADRLAT
jgi:hypothetical protein